MTTDEHLREIITDKILDLLYNNNKQPLDRTFLVSHLGNIFTEHEVDIEKYVTENNLCEVKRQFGMHTWSITTNGFETLTAKKKDPSDAKWYQKILKL